MKLAQLPANEQERLKALNDYYILDLLPESDFEDIMFIAAEICGALDSAVCIVDEARQWIKCLNENIQASLIKDILFAANVKNDTLTIIENMAVDSRFTNKTFVTGTQNILFFAHIPLLTKSGKSIGALCILEHKPLLLSASSIAALRALARQIVSQVELRKKINTLNQLQTEQKGAYADLEKFSFVASHDLRSPLNNIISLTQLLKEDFAPQMNDEGKDYIEFLNNAAKQLADLVSGILEYSRSSQIYIENKETINVPEFLDEVVRLLHAPGNIIVTYERTERNINVSKIVLKQILLNLCENAIKHNDKPICRIEIKFDDGKKYFTFEVKDNGPGIDKADQKRIFELFECIRKEPKKDEGIGVGLSIVKRLVEKSGGEIKIQSETGNDTSFIFTIRK